MRAGQRRCNAGLGFAGQNGEKGHSTGKRCRGEVRLSFVVHEAVGFVVDLAVRSVVSAAITASAAATFGCGYLVLTASMTDANVWVVRFGSWRARRWQQGGDSV